MTSRSDLTVRDMVRTVRAEVRESDLQPDRACELLMRLTAIYGNVLDEVRAADMDYNAVLLETLNTDEAANRARIRAQATPAYARAREAKDTEKMALQMIQSLKKFIASKQEEMRLAR